MWLIKILWAKAKALASDTVFLGGQSRCDGAAMTSTALCPGALAREQIPQFLEEQLSAYFRTAERVGVPAFVGGVGESIRMI